MGPGHLWVVVEVLVEAVCTCAGAVTALPVLWASRVPGRGSARWLPQAGPVLKQQDHRPPAAPGPGLRMTLALVTAQVAPMVPLKPPCAPWLSRPHQPSDPPLLVPQDLGYQSITAFLGIGGATDALTAGPVLA